MKLASIVIMLAACTVAGCVSQSAPPAENSPEVTSESYDALWNTTVDVVSEHFELFAQRKDVGYIISTYKRSDPLPDADYRSDPQTAYDTAEELMHVVRRRLTARILKNNQGIYELHMEIIRERQGYVPPRPDYGGSYSLYDSQKTAIDPAADLGETVTWYPLGRDVYLEHTLRNRILARMPEHPGVFTIAETE